MLAKRRTAAQNHAVPGAVSGTILGIISGNLLFVRLAR